MELNAMFKVMYYKDGQYFGSSVHKTEEEADAAIATFLTEHSGGHAFTVPII